MKKLWTRASIPILVFALILGYAAWTGGAANQCEDGGGQLWAHRGVHVQHPENSVPAVRAAAGQGFPGVEIDVFFDPALGLVVSHDRPYIPVDGKIVLLEEILAAGPGMQFWIDLKNLEYTNRKQVKQALDQLVHAGVVSPGQLRIESASGPALRSLSKNYPCIFWVQYSKAGLRKLLKLAYLKTVIGHASFAGITTHHRYIDAGFRDAFRDHCWYVFTVNDRDRIDELLEIPEVAVILTDLEYNTFSEPTP